MICIRFPDAESEPRALGFLAGRVSFKSWSDGVTRVPNHALSSLTREGIAFLVERRYLVPEGNLIVEIGSPQEQPARQRLAAYLEYEHSDAVHDQSGHPRVLRARRM